MSIPNAQVFLQRLRTDESLNQRVRALRGAGAMAEAAAIGCEIGLDFTEEEYRAAIGLAAEGQLSEAAIKETARQIGIG
jgi:predicted ribosomally synthesized peptide with nif11-like leader